jgi:hypothetical protein
MNTSTSVDTIRGHYRGVEHFCLLWQHDRREAIIPTAEGGIIQDDLLPTPEQADRCTEFLRTPARQFGQGVGKDSGQKLTHLRRREKSSCSHTDRLPN